MCEIGEVFTGFCNGYFGRDSYDDKRVEAFGTDWIVCRESTGTVVIAVFGDKEERDKAVMRWRAV